jgi:TolB protein
MKSMRYDYRLSTTRPQSMPASIAQIISSRRVCLQRGLLLAVAAPLAAWAQFRVEISGVGVTQLPITVMSFRGDDAAPQKIGAIVQADLERSGQFKAIEPGAAGLDEGSRPDMSVLRQKGADHLVAGSITRLADGRFDVRFRLWDVVRSQDLGAQSYVVPAGDLRLLAHRIADFVYAKLTGEKGVFSTRIAYVTKAGQGTSQRNTLWIADSDGEGAQSALASPEPIISANWSPSGAQLAYVSFEARKPVVYVHEVANGRRRLLANFRGSNSAPAWSPDGQQIAITLSRDGNSQIYAMDSAGSSEPRRLSQSGGIDTEPVYSPDGKFIYFVSDRGGAPQIYRMPSGGESVSRAERVTFAGSYNISPALSPDGKSMAFISRVSGQFKLHVMDLASAVAVALTDTRDDERPSFAPNSKLILYATRQGGKEALMTSTIDGRIKARLASQGGDIREPQWGK